MHQKEANKNGADINGYLTDLRWRNSNNNGKLGGPGIPSYFSVVFLYITKCNYPQLSGVYKGRRPANRGSIMQIILYINEGQ